MSRELFNEATKSSRASSLLQGLCSANMREIKQIAALSVQAGRHHRQEAATAPVGASLSRELFNEATKSSRDKLAPTGFVQCKHAGDKADRSPLHPGRKAPQAGGCNFTCRSELARELFNEAAKSSRASSLLRGLCSANMREIKQIAALSVQAGRHHMQEAATAPVGASLSRELFNEATKSSRDKLAPTGFVQCKHAGDKADRSPLHPGR